MQENNKNASILILSIILSLILWVIFISLSNKISLNLRQNSNFIEKISNEEKIEKNLKLIENELKNILKEIKNPNDSSKIDKKNEVALESAIVTTSDYFKKINIKNIWWYSKIDIISSNYFIPQKKYFQIVEKFGKKEILKKDWFLNIN